MVDVYSEKELVCYAYNIVIKGRGKFYGQYSVNRTFLNNKIRRAIECAKSFQDY